MTPCRVCGVDLDLDPDLTAAGVCDTCDEDACWICGQPEDECACSDEDTEGSDEP